MRNQRRNTMSIPGITDQKVTLDLTISAEFTKGGELFHGVPHGAS
jgi:hypothetical protein